MGIAAVYNPDKSDCIDYLHTAIFQINHTGQECCGIAVYDNKKISSLTHAGLVRELKIPENMHGWCGIGNVNKYVDHQPRKFNSPKLGEFAITFDGYIINRKELKNRVGGVFSSLYDVELAARIISDGKDFPDGIEHLARNIKGAFCISILTENGEIYASRCPLALKPLIWGQGKNSYAVITESRAFRKAGMEPVKDIEPGEIVKIDDYGIHTVKKIEGKGRKHCSFQWGYFAWIDSVIEGIPVSKVRERVAAILAKKDKDAGLDIDLVCAIEDSGKAYGEGYAMAFGAPYLTCIPKYPYAIRSYERPKESREKEAYVKFSTVDERIKGKKVVVCDDSIRRGTVTRKGPLRFVRAAGAKEIHLRIGTPKNIAYCRFDDRDAGDETLLANQLKTDEEIAKYLEVDSVKFPEVDEFVSAIVQGSKLKADDLCLGCYTKDFSFLLDD
ncbi:MAG: hypothetical protein QXP39_00915 [Candidatus Aenigmatarchaeota archaeon]